MRPAAARCRSTTHVRFGMMWLADGSPTPWARRQMVFEMLVLKYDVVCAKLYLIYELASNMRTTITLDDEAFATANAYARARALKLGQAISELIIRGSADRLPMKQIDGVWVFELPATAALLTSLQVERLLDESA